MILTIHLLQRLWKINYTAEARRVGDAYAAATNRRLYNRTIAITRPEATGATIQELVDRHQWDVVFGRMKHDGHLALAGGQTRLSVGDLVSVVGTLEDLDRVTAYLGQASDERLELDRSEFDYRRVFVSHPKIAGQRLRDLNVQDLRDLQMWFNLAWFGPVPQAASISLILTTMSCRLCS
jgi:putative transport protein